MMSYRRIRRYLIPFIVFTHLWLPLTVQAQHDCVEFSPERIVDAIQLSPAIPRQASRGVNQLFSETRVSVSLKGGMSVRLAGSSDGRAPLVVDDYIYIVIHSTKQTWQHDFRNRTHTAILPLEPQNLDAVFSGAAGAIEISYQAQDLMGPEFRSSSVWLIVWQACAPTSTPPPTATTTATPMSTATNTAVPPTYTYTPLPTATHTATHTATATNTAVPPTYTYTPPPTVTATNTPQPTATQTQAPTVTSTPTAVGAALDSSDDNLFEPYRLIWFLGTGGVGLLFGLVALNQRAQARRLRGELDISVKSKGVWLTTVNLDERKAAELIIDPAAEADLPARGHSAWRAHVRKSAVGRGIEIAEMVPGLEKPSWRYVRLHSGESVTMGDYTFTYQSLDAQVDDEVHELGGGHVPANEL